jgi:hypothetical protein
MAKKIPFPTNAAYEVHSHVFVSGPRHGGHYENNKWHTGEFSHSHPQGSTPHTHPQTGPSSYGYGWARGKSNKLTAKPTGEQMPPIPLTEEENTFELIVTDSALIHGKLPIGDTPLEALGFPAAERIMGSHRMKCVVRDERTKKELPGLTREIPCGAEMTDKLLQK